MRSIFLPQGSRLNEVYTVDKVVRVCGFGLTYRVRDDHDCPYYLHEFRPLGTWSQVDLTQARRRFLSEGRLIARLNHQGIARVVETFEQHQTAYVVTESVTGRNLESLLLDKGTMPVWDALDLIRRIGDTLEAVHSQGLLHGNVQPANVVVTEEGQAVLINFELSGRMTAQQAVLLTPGYSAPELCVEGEVQGAQIDVYGLAATLYHILGGQAAQSSHGLRALCPGISLSLETAVSQGLAQRVKVRPPTVQAFLATLDSQEVPLFLSVWSRAALPPAQNQDARPDLSTFSERARGDLRLALLMEFLSLGGLIFPLCLVGRAWTIRVPLGRVGKAGTALLCGLMMLSWPYPGLWAIAQLAWLAYCARVCHKLERPDCLIRLASVLCLALSLPLLLFLAAAMRWKAWLGTIFVVIALATTVFYGNFLLHLMWALKVSEPDDGLKPSQSSVC